MKYFDKDFFKFFWGFMAILIISLVLIAIGKMYQEKEIANTVNIANPTSN
jgi:hypothetical protein